MPKIQLKDVQKAIKVGKEVLPMVQPYIEQYAPMIIEQVQEKANLAAENGKKAKLEFLNGIQEKKEIKELSKAADDSRKKTVSSSLPPITAKAFFENFENNVSDGSELDSGYMGFTGCYAILTMKSSREKDLSAYKDVLLAAASLWGLRCIPSCAALATLMFTLISSSKNLCGFFLIPAMKKSWALNSRICCRLCKR